MKDLLTNPGSVPPPPSVFSKIVEEEERDKIHFLLHDCPEVEMPSLVPSLDALENIDFPEVLEALPSDIRHIIEYTAGYDQVDPIFRLSGFLKGGATCTGLRAGLRHGKGQSRLDRGTLHIASIGESSGGKGRGDKIFREAITAIETDLSLHYDVLYEAWKVRAAEYDSLTRKEKQEEGAIKIKRPKNIRAYTVSPTEGAVVELHLNAPHAGVALWTSELGNAMQEMTKHSKGGSEETARNFCISGFDANEDYRRDKMTHDGERGDLIIPQFGFSMLGGLQTPYAKNFFVGKFSEAQGRGSCERFLMFTGEDILVDKDDLPTLESLKDSSGKHEYSEIYYYLYKKYRAMLYADKTMDYYTIAKDQILDPEKKDIKELNLFIDAGIQTKSLIFKLQDTALLELAQFLHVMKAWRQRFDYSPQEKSSVAYDEMKIAKVITVLHYFKWCDFPLRIKSQMLHMVDGAARIATVDAPYNKIDLKYSNIENIPVTIDTVQAAIKVVLFGATCRRELFQENATKNETQKNRGDMENKKMAFMEWASGQTVKQQTAAEIAAGCKIFKNDTKAARKFLKEILGLEPQRVTRGMIFDFSKLEVSLPVDEDIKDPRQPSGPSMFRKR